MISETFQYTASDGLKVNTYKWLPDTGIDLKGIVLLVHGSVEHAGRYAHFATFLTTHGYGMYAPDLRGHGLTGSNSRQLAHLDYKKGWSLLLNDLMILYDKIIKTHASLPLFTFGHSMGSFVVRDLIGNYPARWSGAVICGSTLGKPLLAKSLFPLAKLLLLFNKQNKPSKLLHGLAFNPLNKAIKNPRTPVDFVNSDPSEVDKYVNDPFCGCTISIGFANELAWGSLKAAKPKTIKKTPDELPVFFISGTDDPVGGKNGKDVMALYKVFKAYGKKQVSLKLYEKARHEIINEYVKQQVMDDVVVWMDTILNKIQG